MKTGYTLPGLARSLLTFGSIIIIISTGLLWFNINLQILLLTCIVIAAFSTWQITHDGFKPIREAMNASVQQALGTIYIFILIGILIATFVQSGTIPALMYYSLKYLSPCIFLPSVLIFCSLISFAIGSCWGTVAILGLALINIGSPAGIPIPVIAGAIISGASFGEKISPVSASTNFVAASSNVNLYKHIKSMMYTTIPTYIIVLILYTVIGMKYSSHGMYLNNINNLTDTLTSNFHINIICLLPIFIMIILNICRVSPEPSMIAAIISAIFISYFIQNNSIIDITCAMLNGGESHGKEGVINQLLSIGGILSVTKTMSISLLALMLGGILQKFGFFHILIEAAIKKVKRAATLVTVTVISCFFGNISMGEAYMSVMLGGKTFADIYNRHGVDRTVLSRSLEEGAIMTTSIIPWTTGGVFLAYAMNVCVISYLPWALLNWLNPLVSILFAFCGIALWRNKKQHNQATCSKNLIDDKLENMKDTAIRALKKYNINDFNIKKLPVNIIRDIPRLMVDRTGLSQSSRMVTDGIVGFVEPDKIYQLTHGSLFPVSHGHVRVLPEAISPPLREYGGIWSSTVEHRCSDANILGGNGSYQLDKQDDELIIPIAETTREHLSFYNCRLIKAGEFVIFESSESLPVFTMDIGKDYIEDYLMNPEAGGGAYLEVHNKPHLHMPLNAGASGYLIIGRKSHNEKRIFSAFKIPFGYAVYMPPWTIHSDAQLTGKYMVIYSVASKFSTVTVRKHNMETATVRLVPLHKK